MLIFKFNVMCEAMFWIWVQNLTSVRNADPNSGFAITLMKAEFLLFILLFFVNFYLVSL
jgi:hypothetical protein